MWYHYHYIGAEITIYELMLHIIEVIDVYRKPHWASSTSVQKVNMVAIKVCQFLHGSCCSRAKELKYQTH